MILLLRTSLRVNFCYFPVGKSGISEKDSTEDEMEEETQRVNILCFLNEKNRAMI